ncbi:MAG: lactate utilization protein [Halieaceae bacterium]|nr:lactate utilization protein [Halieaceae bacterium]
MADSGPGILAEVRRRQYGDADSDSIAEDLAALGHTPVRPLDEDEVLEHFLTRLKTNRVDLEVAASKPEAVKRIARFVYREYNGYRAVAGNDRRLAALPWRDGGVLVRFGAATPEDAVSISYARYGIAETGSMVLYCNRDNPAANNWLTRDHIVILESRDLVASLEDAWTGIRRDTDTEGLPRGVTLVSGPSSTGDIIGHLVKGAHGPLRLRVIFLGHVPEELLTRVGFETLPL